ncbi:hypothetical protein PTSG_03629 [Salpingoeca rosetta]|uniref:SANT domain-containing protein n=1 Tax=Salpingoeca rosetta (strain ATCC 50818 / BSB-021) TaxID=946362 RepID=F2U652_SALR5|nr:uncharacterized protein PTSG_03629 [Salpingoeca rosetta]EGD82993.1 hypothetical protein PTSG_03629 [Salpingoeca rosetta]|eukprot:XP_004995357.1 hypothetical protein PTSG_03629 [Salpingoeca rosetta]
MASGREAATTTPSGGEDARGDVRAMQDDRPPPALVFSPEKQQQQHQQPPSKNPPTTTATTSAASAASAPVVRRAQMLPDFAPKGGKPSRRQRDDGFDMSEDDDEDDDDEDEDEDDEDEDEEDEDDDDDDEEEEDGQQRSARQKKSSNRFTSSTSSERSLSPTSASISARSPKGKARVQRVDKSPTKPTPQRSKEESTEYWLEQMNLKDAELARLKQDLATLRRRRVELQELLHHEREHHHELHSMGTSEDAWLAEETGQETLQALIKRVYRENQIKARKNVPEPVRDVLEDARALLDPPPPQHYNAVRRVCEKTPSMITALTCYVAKCRSEDEAAGKKLAAHYLALQKEWTRRARRAIVDARQQSLSNFEYFQEVLPKSVQTEPPGAAYDPDLESTSGVDPADVPSIFDPNDVACTFNHIARVARDSPQLFGHAKRTQPRIVDTNRLVADPVGQHEILANVNAWTAEEEQTFLKRYMQTPKDFVKIAKHLPRKSVAECVLYYYRSKYRVGYKARLEQLRKERNQKRRKKEKSKRRRDGSKAKAKQQQQQRQEQEEQQQQQEKQQQQQEQEDQQVKQEQEEQQEVKQEAKASAQQQQRPSSSSRDARQGGAARAKEQ